MAVYCKVSPQMASGKYRRVEWFQERINSADASGAGVTLVAAVSGQTLTIQNLSISVGAAITVTITDGTATLFGPLYMAANTTEFFPISLTAAAVSRGMKVVTSGAGNITCNFEYFSEE